MMTYRKMVPRLSRFALLLALLTHTCIVLAQQKGTSPAPSTQSPRAGVYEKYSAQLPAQADAEHVRQAILAHKPQIQAQGTDLQLRHSKESPGGYHFTFDQTFQGIPIYGAEIKANLNRQMRFMNLLDNLRTFTATPATFQKTDAQVTTLLPTMFNQGETDFHLFPNDRCYFLQESRLIPAHRVSYTANTQTWEVILTDSDLRELHRRDMAAYRKPLPTVPSPLPCPDESGSPALLPLAPCPLPLTDTTGNAMVFLPDPLTSSGNAYGAPYSDNNDADNPQLTAQRVSVTLKDINWTGTVFELKGPHVQLEEREAPTVPIVTSVDGNFLFMRSQSGFEDVMVYYHIDSFQRYVQSLGFTNLQNTAVKADPHGLNGQDNSHFVATDARVAFGEGGVDDAEDADVVIHEYGHALSHSGSPFSNSGTERQGLDEGIGDYVATTYSRSISYNFWKNCFTWDGHNEYWPGRSASDPTLYPPSSPDIYLYGSIWASTLMEVWPVIGKQACDKVFFESLYGHAPNMTLTDAALIHIDADSNLYGGAHHDHYQEAFCLRGILTGTLPGQGCFVGVDEWTPDGLEWGLFPNPAGERVNLMVPGWRGRFGLQYALLDIFGREMVAGDVEGVQTEIAIDHLAAGIYLVRLSGKGGWHEVLRLRVE
jgi:hypothetical protein